MIEEIEEMAIEVVEGLKAEEVAKDMAEIDREVTGMVETGREATGPVQKDKEQKEDMRTVEMEKEAVLRQKEYIKITEIDFYPYNLKTLQI